MSGTLYVLTETTVGLFIKYALTGFLLLILLCFNHRNRAFYGISVYCSAITIFMLLSFFAATPPVIQKSLISAISFFLPFVLGYLAYEFAKYERSIENFFHLWTNLAVISSAISAVIFALLNLNLLQLPFSETEPVLRLPLIGGIHRDIRMAFWFNEANHFAQFLMVPLFFEISRERRARIFLLMLGLLSTLSISAFLGILATILLARLHYILSFIGIIFLLIVSLFLPWEIILEILTPERQHTVSQKFEDYYFLLTHLREFPFGNGFVNINDLGKEVDVNLASGFAEPVLFYGWVGVAAVIYIIFTLAIPIVRSRNPGYLRNGTFALALATLVHGPLLSGIFMFLYFASLERSLADDA